MSDGGKGQLANQETEEKEINRLLLGIMEGYNDTVIPSLSYFSPNHENGTISRKRQKTSEASWAESLLSERKRREQMSEKFSLLQSMVPSLFNSFKSEKLQSPREKIISDTVDYIKYLQEEIERLEGLMKFQRKEQNVEKLVLLKCTNRNSSVKVTASNGATFLAIQLPSRRGSVLDIVKVLEKNQAEVLEARISVNEQRILTFTATVRLGSDGGNIIDKIREEISTL